MNANALHHEDMCPVIATALLLPLSAIIASLVVPGPGASDIYAAIGASIAAVVVVFELGKKNRAWGQNAVIFLVSVFTGIAGPGAYVYNVKGMEYAASLSWHMWLVYGLLFGLAGWALVMAALKLLLSNSFGILKSVAKVFGWVKEDETKTNKNE